MARLLANENIPRLAVQRLRVANHDVAWVAEEAKGASDPVIAAWAKREDRLLLTFDQDFADRIVRRQLTQPPGLILCRFRVQSPEVIAQRLVEAFQRPLIWQGHFALIESTDIRLVPLL